MQNSKNKILQKKKLIDDINGVQEKKQESFKLFCQALSHVIQYYKGDKAQMVEKVSKTNRSISMNSFVYIVSINATYENLLKLVYLEDQEENQKVQISHLIKQFLRTIDKQSEQFHEQIFSELPEDQIVFAQQISRFIFDPWIQKIKSTCLQNLFYQQSQKYRKETIIHLKKIVGIYNSFLSNAISIQKLKLVAKNIAEKKLERGFTYENHLRAYIILNKTNFEKINIRNDQIDFNFEQLDRKFQAFINQRYRDILKGDSLNMSLQETFQKVQDLLQITKKNFGFFELFNSQKWQYNGYNFQKAFSHEQFGNQMAKSDVQQVLNRLKRISYRLALKQNCLLYFKIIFKDQSAFKARKIFRQKCNDDIFAELNKIEKTINKSKEEPHRFAQYKQFYEKILSLKKNFLENKTNKILSEGIEEVFQLMKDFKRTEVSIINQFLSFHLFYDTICQFEKKFVKDGEVNQIKIYQIYLLKDLFFKFIKYAEQLGWILQMSKIKAPFMSGRKIQINLHNIMVSYFTRKNASTYNSISYHFKWNSQENQKKAYSQYQKFIIMKEKNDIDDSLTQNIDLLMLTLSLWSKNETFLKNKKHDKIKISFGVGSKKTEGNQKSNYDGKNKLEVKFHKYFNNNFSQYKNQFIVDQQINKTVLNILFNAEILDNTKRNFRRRGEIHPYFQKIFDQVNQIKN